jgi:WhiB family redox-sensing transcriptional regulator
MTVLFSELLVPGWAAEGGKIGLDGVTQTSDSAMAFTLPCHTADPELFFAEDAGEIAAAKALCAQCPMQARCLEGAISRQEPCGVWGGELFEAGEIIARKRTVGRPRLAEMAPLTLAPVAEINEMTIGMIVEVQDKEREEIDAA